MALTNNMGIFSILATHVNNKVCSLIIDGWSYANFSSALLVEKLQLPTLEHPKPYRL